MDIKGTYKFKNKNEESKLHFHRKDVFSYGVFHEGVTYYTKQIFKKSWSKNYAL